MKFVYVLRHAHKSFITGGLTSTGIRACKELKKRLPTFKIVISSEKKRCIETAQLLSGQDPIQDPRANIEAESGQELAELATETLKKIHDGEYALIVSHSPCIPAAMAVLDPKAPRPGFHELEGFTLDENKELQEFSV